MIVQLAILFLCVHLATLEGTRPEQIHIGYGRDPTEMVVIWHTRVKPSTTPMVLYGRKTPNIPAKGSTVVLGGPYGILQNIEYVHRARLTELKPGATYVYKCGCPSNWSQVFNFTAMRDGTNWSPRFVVYGDMGLENAKSLPWLTEEAKRGDFDAVIHAGDMAYDMAWSRGEIGDKFMNMIQPLAARFPYMTCAGNHEFHYNFTNYKTRFSGLGGGHGDPDGMFYSFNIGPAHIISLTTEFYIDVSYGIEQAIRQYNWLEKDLQEATKPENRAKRPWIITMGHRPMYCSDKVPWDCYNNESTVRVGVPYIHLYGLEPLYHKYGIDLAIWAHEHSYERLWPIYDKKVKNGSYDAPYTNPKAPVHIITGSAGCREKIDVFGPKPAWSAFRLSDYGYTRMKIENTTHLQIEQFSVDKEPNGSVVDKITIIKDYHGPYP